MMMIEFIKNLQLFTSQNTGINMAQESIDDFIQMAKDYAKAEKELGVQHWVFVSIERKGEFGDRERIYSYDLPRELYERRKWVIRWRAAKLQCQYPKDSINCYLSYYDNRLGNDLKLTDDLRTLISCKAQVSKQQRLIDEYVAWHSTNDLFFDEENDDGLMKVRKKLAQKVANVKAAEERLKLKIKEYETERKRLDTASR